MKRTTKQQAALEVYCREVANSLNEAGYDLKAVLEAKPIPISCTQENIKENIFKPIAKALYPVDSQGKELKSTTQLEKIWITDVYEHMNRWLGENFEQAAHVPFPSDEDV